MNGISAARAGNTVATRDIEDAAVVVAVLAALVTAAPPAPAVPAATGWAAPVLREPLPPAAPGSWWSSGSPR